MPHLGADLTAYVDGQLSADAAATVDAHLETCEQCAQAVRQQKLLKSRISTVGVPKPSAALLASLTELPVEPPAPPTWLDRVRRLAPVSTVLALAGVSLVAVAYVAGAQAGDPIRPPIEDYAADFFGATATSVSAAYSDDAVAELTEQGWSCADELAGDMHRTTTGYDTSSGTIEVTYTNGAQRLRLYEQPGTLDTSRLDGFDHRTVGGADVWVSEGDPTMLLWDRDGVVYTVVTDVDPERLARAVTELPDPETVSPAQRIGNGLHKMSAWMPAA